MEELLFSEIDTVKRISDPLERFIKGMESIAETLKNEINSHNLSEIMTKAIKELDKRKQYDEIIYILEGASFIIRNRGSSRQFDVQRIIIKINQLIIFFSKKKKKENKEEIDEKMEIKISELNIDKILKISLHYDGVETIGDLLTSYKDTGEFRKANYYCNNSTLNGLINILNQMEISHNFRLLGKKDNYIETKEGDLERLFRRTKNTQLIKRQSILSLLDEEKIKKIRKGAVNIGEFIENYPTIQHLKKEVGLGSNEIKIFIEKLNKFGISHKYEL